MTPVDGVSLGNSLPWIVKAVVFSEAQTTPHRYFLKWICAAVTEANYREVQGKKKFSPNRSKI